MERLGLLLGPNLYFLIIPIAPFLIFFIRFILQIPRLYFLLQLYLIGHICARDDSIIDCIIWEASVLDSHNQYNETFAI